MPKAGRFNVNKFLDYFEINFEIYFTMTYKYTLLILHSFEKKRM